MRNRKLIVPSPGFPLLSISILSLFFCACQSVEKTPARSDALWNIVHTQCFPKWLQKAPPEPCAEVKADQTSGRGYAILKDRNGPLQFLLLPTEKVIGIEAKEVLRADEIPYFGEAWTARKWLQTKTPKTVDDQFLSLALNSSQGRSQNQLHIHISCVRPAVHDAVVKARGQIGKAWIPFPEMLLGHHYLARQITLNELMKENLFLLLSAQVPDAHDHMGDYGIAVLPLPEKNQFMVLAAHADASNSDRGSAEETQDHSCSQLDLKDTGSNAGLI